MLGLSTVTVGHVVPVKLAARLDACLGLTAIPAALPAGADPVISAASKRRSVVRMEANAAQ